MDKRQQQFERHVVGAAVEALRVQGLGVGEAKAEKRAGGPRGRGLGLRIEYGGKAVDYACAVQGHLRPATLGAVLHQLRQLEPPALLVADYVTPPLAEELRKRGVEFIDAAGNAFLNQPPLLVWIKGQRPRQRVVEPKEGRAFTASGLQVLFALLCRPGIVGRPYREIAQLAGVAHGTIGWVMGDLLQNGFLAKVGGRRRLLQAERLLQDWAPAYARILRPKLHLGRFRADVKTDIAGIDPGPYGYVLGGEVAEARLTQHLRPATLTLYGPGINKRLVVDLRLTPDPEGNVELLRRFWNFDTEPAGVAPLPLVYADLLALGDPRCVEAANLVHERIVRGFVE